MPLICSCPSDPEEDEWYYSPNGYTETPADGRRKRCKSCRALIAHGACAAQFERERSTRSDVEDKIYGEDGHVRLAPWWLCEVCADIAFSLEDLGFCIDILENQHEQLREYHEFYRDGFLHEPATCR